MGKYLYKYALAIFPIIALLLFLKNYLDTPKSNNIINLKIGQTDYLLEIANTGELRQQGLSDRTTLCQNCGMLFVFEKEGIYPFWMKDTRLPLDIIFLDKNGQIVTKHTAQPQPEAKIWELKLYQNANPAKYVIELNANDFEKNKLKIGNTIKINL